MSEFQSVSIPTLKLPLKKEDKGLQFLTPQSNKNGTKNLFLFMKEPESESATSPSLSVKKRDIMEILQKQNMAIQDLTQRTQEQIEGSTSKSKPSLNKSRNNINGPIIMTIQDTLPKLEKYINSKNNSNCNTQKRLIQKLISSKRQYNEKQEKDNLTISSFCASPDKSHQRNNTHVLLKSQINFQDQSQKIKAINQQQQETPSTIKEPDSANTLNEKKISLASSDFNIAEFSYHQFDVLDRDQARLQEEFQQRKNSTLSNYMRLLNQTSTIVEEEKESSDISHLKLKTFFVKDNTIIIKDLNTKETPNITNFSQFQNSINRSGTTDIIKEEKHEYSKNYSIVKKKSIVIKSETELPKDEGKVEEKLQVKKVAANRSRRPSTFKQQAEKRRNTVLMQVNHAENLAAKLEETIDNKQQFKIQEVQDFTSALQNHNEELKIEQEQQELQVNDTINETTSSSDQSSSSRSEKDQDRFKINTKTYQNSVNRYREDYRSSILSKIDNSNSLTRFNNQVQQPKLSPTKKNVDDLSYEDAIKLPYIRGSHSRNQSEAGTRTNLQDQSKISISQIANLSQTKQKNNLEFRKRLSLICQIPQIPSGKMRQSMQQLQKQSIDRKIKPDVPNIPKGMRSYADFFSKEKREGISDQTEKHPNAPGSRKTSSFKLPVKKDSSKKAYKIHGKNF